MDWIKKVTEDLATDAEVRKMDDELGLEGVPVTDRAHQAMLRWIRTSTTSGGNFGVAGEWWDAKFRALHPSMPAKGQPFMYLCVSAKGVSYEFSPPIIFGTIGLNPHNFIKITPPELERIFRSAPVDFSDLNYQCSDAIDLFLSRVDFHPKNPAASAMTSVGMAQLQASARQLVASEVDPSLPQGSAMAAELVMKGVLMANGVEEKELFKFGHDLKAIAVEVVRRLPGSSDAELLEVARMAPHYAQVRYKPPTLNMRTSQDYYRRALFLCSETMRRTGHHNSYHQAKTSPGSLSRNW